MTVVKLICMDMDGVLVPPKNFWLELHRAYGTLEEGAQLTKQYLYTDYERLVQEVVGRLWKGRPAAVFHELVNSYEYTPGIKELFLELDRFQGDDGERVPRVIITGGCYDIARRIADEFGVDFVFGNELVIKDGKITGEFRWPVGAAGYSKQQIIEQLCEDLEILPQDVLFIGDSDGDLDAFRICGVSIAYNTKSAQLRHAATAVVDGPTLRSLLPVLEQAREGSAAPGTPKL